MPVFVIIIFLSYILGNVYVFVRGIHALGQITVFFKTLLAIIYFICSLLPFAFFFLRNAKYVPFSVGHFIYQFGTSWLVFVLYMVIFLAATDLFRLFNRNFSCGFIVSFSFTICLFIYGYINNKRIDKQTFDININKSPNGARSLKIVAISDWHLGLGSSKTDINSVISKINREKPDIILIAGDLIDNSVPMLNFQQTDKDLNRLKASEGIFMVPGNHEYISGMEACKRFIRKTKIELLMDSLITLPCGLQIIGRDDRSNHKRMSAVDWKNIIDRNKPTIILDHQPIHLKDAQTVGADIQISGHTHHGQIIPLSWLTDYMFDIGYGFAKRNGTNYYVSSGVSLWGPPFRIGTNNEIVVFNITFENLP
jgi:predicted MPP superfamily phosphohydrolase